MAWARERMVLLILLGGVCGCPSGGEVDSDNGNRKNLTAPKSIREVTAGLATKAAQLAGAMEADVKKGAEAPAITEEDEFILRGFERYLSPAEVRRYLSTHIDERFTIWGDRLLDLQRRDALLDKHRNRLEAADVDRYYRLPTFAAARKFIRERIDDGQ